MTLAEIEKAKSREAQALGSQGFPLCFWGNAVAYRQFGEQCAGLLNLPAVNRSPVENRAVSRLVSQLLQLDAQIHRKHLLPIPAAGGFDLYAIHPSVAKLHALKSELRFRTRFFAC